MRAHPLRLVAVLIAAVVLASCGLATDSSPETLSRDNLPEDLGGTSASTSLPEAPEMTQATLWFVETGDEARLRPTTRSVPLNSSVKVVLENLLSGPTDVQTEVTTAIPDGVTLPEDLELAPDENGILVLDLPEQFYEGAAAPREAFAQVVLTVTEMPGVQAVQFQFDGEDRAAIDGDRREVQGPVGYDDYARLVSQRAGDR